MWIDVQGERIFAATGGMTFDPARPVLVLVHGAGLDHSVWALQDRALARGGLSVLSLDLPGHGRSGGSPPGSIAGLADWLVHVLDAVGVASAAVAGHSMGALTALALAARYPERVRAIGLLGAAAIMPVHRDLLAAAAADPGAAFTMMAGWSFSWAGALGGSPVPGMWMAGAADALWRRSRPGVLHADLAACNAYVDGEADAARTRCPALVVAGGRDRMAHVTAGQALAALLPQGRLLVVEGAGHMLMTERPDEIRQALASL